MPRRLLRVGAGLAGIAALVGAGVVADMLVRDGMERVAREEIAVALQLEDADQVDAEVIGGSALVQLLLGSVDRVSITVPELDLGVADGTFHAEIYDLPTNPLTPIPRVYSYVALDHDSVVQLTGDFVDAPVVDVALQPPALRVELEARLPWGATPVTVVVEPVTRGGRIVLVPETVELGAAELSPAQFEERTGVSTGSLFDQTGFCIADSVPTTMETTDVRVSNGAVILVFGIEQRSVLQLQAPHGSCAG
ncbi:MULTISPECIES: LmeA family phospholipid-binding protein [unclassified Agrococcus]|uniref:LmeA family phospholipid-binding protein n=1 Tax=unclassified Agrococcus TaxID=2615065 RepID=UPI00361A8B2B